MTSARTRRVQDFVPFRTIPLMGAGAWSGLTAVVFTDLAGLIVLRTHLGDQAAEELRGARDSHGRSTVSMPASEWLCTPERIVRGAISALIIDIALACAIQTSVEGGDGFVVLDARVNSLRAILGNGRPVTGIGVLTHRGSSLSVAHTSVENADGNQIALATGSVPIG